MPILDSDGHEAALRDDAGQVVKTRFSEVTLRRIATVTGGRYIRSATGAELAAGVDDIVKGERRILSWRTTTAYRDLYPACLALAAAAGTALWWLL